jgi:hypothetical protein
MMIAAVRFSEDSKRQRVKGTINGTAVTFLHIVCVSAMNAVLLQRILCCRVVKLNVLAAVPHLG